MSVIYGEAKNLIQETKKKNIAVQKFIGEDSEKIDLRQHNTWYSTEILTYLTHLLPQNPDSFRYVFTRDITDEERSIISNLRAYAL